MLDFYSSDYGKDFEICIGLNDLFDEKPENEDIDLWLKAYDTSCCENDLERTLCESGYAFDCYATLRSIDGHNICIGRKSAKSEEEAKAFLTSVYEGFVNISKLFTEA
jgi:hypothetical protein